MCGRFSLAKDAPALEAAFEWFDIDPMIMPRFNIAPTQPVVTILNRGRPATTFTQWGLIPSWSKDPRIAYKLVNARSETAHEKPSFRGSFRRKRCLLPADGYYEWKTVTGTRVKQPVYYRLRGHPPFCLAGLWDEWHDAEGGLYITSTILTCRPNDLAQLVHARMPVILPPEHWGAWLDPHFDKVDELRDMLRPYPSRDMESHEVSRVVNRAANDVRECIEPLPPENELQLG